MHRDAGRTAAARLLLLAGLLGWAAAPAGAEEPLSVTYGPAALSAEGDQDYRELIYLERARHDHRPALPARVRRGRRRRARHALRRRLGRRGALRPVRRQGRGRAAGRAPHREAGPARRGGGADRAAGGPRRRAPGRDGGRRGRRLRRRLADARERPPGPGRPRRRALRVPPRGDRPVRQRRQHLHGDAEHPRPPRRAARGPGDRGPRADGAGARQPPRHRGRARPPGRGRPDRGRELRPGGGPAHVREHVAVRAAHRLRAGRVAAEHGRAAARGARRHSIDRGRPRPGAAQRPDPVRHRR